jgi:hypothetical protein
MIYYLFFVNAGTEFYFRLTIQMSLRPVTLLLMLIKKFD